VKVGIIGAGAMGEAILAALIKGGFAAADSIWIYDVVSERLETLAKRYGVSTASDPVAVADGADYLIVAVKPQDFAKAAAPLAGRLAPDATALSIMAGVTLARLRIGLQHEAVVRAMPNTPAQIGEGVTVWTATPAVSEAGRAGAGAIFRCLGWEAYVPEERYLDMATALSGSGPGYVFLFIEALIDAGVRLGLARDLATAMALQTVAGSARYAQATGKHPAELRDLVTSPGGTTAEGLQALEAGRFRAAVAEAVKAAYDKSVALGEAQRK
jgi:pyrroline-5-carboxylate reductase